MFNINIRNLNKKLAVFEIIFFYAYICDINN